MEYVLLHRNDLVANIEFSETGIYEHVNGFYDRNLMPPGTRVDDALIDARFKVWLEQRILPSTRSNRTRLLNLANVIRPEQLIERSYLLSLSDHYWIKRRDKIDLKPFWEDVNPHNYINNGFVSNVLLFNDTNNLEKDFLSPDITTSGKFDKAWLYEDNIPYLYKCGMSDFDYLDIYNEQIVDYVANILDLPHVKYETVQFDDERVFSKSKCFIDIDHEFFPMSSISTEKGSIGKLGVLKFCKENGFKKQLDKILVLDFLLCVADRDFTNLGFIRNANTLEIESLAPIYDNGFCLWCDYKQQGIGILDEAKTFDSSHEHQIKLVDDLDFVDFDKLRTVSMYISSIYGNLDMDIAIQNKIVEEYKNRLRKLAELATKEEEEVLINNSSVQSVATISQTTSGGFGF